VLVFPENIIIYQIEIEMKSLFMNIFYFSLLDTQYSTYLFNPILGNCGGVFCHFLKLLYIHFTFKLICCYDLRFSFNCVHCL